MAIERKYKTINYIDGHRLEDGILVPQNKSKDIMLTNTKRFHNCIYLILGVGRLERVLMDWISEEMDTNNYIRNDVYTRSNFIEFIRDVKMEGKKTEYEDTSVNSAFHNLKSVGLLIPVRKGLYQVNPEYYWRGTDKDREEQIMLNIKFNSKNNNFKVYAGGKHDVFLKRDGKR